MHKLVILIHPSANWQEKEDEWPEFLHLAESMPGLRREATSRVERFLYGEPAVVHMHELFFETLEQAENAMASIQGRQAGALLQRMSGGRMTLFIADHKEDDIANLLKYRKTDAPQK